MLTDKDLEMLRRERRQDYLAEEARDDDLRRYALATDKDTSAGLIWSTGGVWSANVPEAGRLMTGPEADEFLARVPGAVVVDVVVYRAMCKVWREAFNAALDGVEASTPELRTRARLAGREALERSGYSSAAAKVNPFNPCEV